MTQSRPRILIAGAGPTGLTLANTLRRFAIDFDIIDVKSGLSKTSKGLSLNVSSQSNLSILRLRNQVGVNGQKIRKLSLIHNRQRVLYSDFDRLDGDRYLITQPQSETEKELYHALGEKVRWDTRLLAVESQGGGYSATLELPDGKQLSQEYDYVIGCEGKNSIVREAIGATLSGADYPTYFILADFHLQREVLHSEVHYVQDGDQFFIIIPLTERKYRMVIVAEQAGGTAEQISERLAAVVNDYYAEPLIQSPAFWTSSAKIYLRIADKMRQDGLFICGDSAHLVSPIGGTGMNMGIQDAFNLGCKLASVIHGIRPYEILDDYQFERLDHVRESCLATDRTTKMIFDDEFRQENIAMFTPNMAKRPMLRHTLPLAFSGLGIRYPVRTEDETTELQSIWGGKLFAHIAQLYDSGVLQEIKPLVLVLQEKAVPSAVEQLNSGQDLAAWVSRCQNNFDQVFHWLCVAEDGLPGCESVTRAQIGKELPADGVFLINSEGFIEFAGSQTDISSLDAYLDQRYLQQHHQRGEACGAT